MWDEASEEGEAIKRGAMLEGECGGRGRALTEANDEYGMCGLTSFTECVKQCRDVRGGVVEILGERPRATGQLGVPRGAARGHDERRARRDDHAMARQRGPKDGHRRLVSAQPVQ